MAGLPKWKSEREWWYQEKARPPWGRVGDWHKHIGFVRTVWEQDGRPVQPNDQGGGTTIRRRSVGSVIFERKTKLDALKAQAAKHPGNESSRASNEPTTAQVREFEGLQREVDTLEKQLAGINPGVLTNKT